MVFLVDFGIGRTFLTGLGVWVIDVTNFEANGLGFSFEGATPFCPGVRFVDLASGASTGLLPFDFNSGYQLLPWV